MQKRYLNCRTVLSEEQMDIHCEAAIAGGTDSPAHKNPLVKIMTRQDQRVHLTISYEVTKIQGMK